MGDETRRERVLVFGDDMRIFLTVVRSLGRAGKEVHAAPFNWHSPALSSAYISKVHRFPRYSDDPTAWRESVLAVLRTHDFDLVVPCCDDRAILPFHIHRDEVASYPIQIPSAEAMTLLFDKERTRLLCTELGIPVADGTRIGPSDTAPALAARFGFPLVLKPRRSYWEDRLESWGKVWIIESEGELASLLSTLDQPSRYLAEGYFEGVGVGLSVLADKGEVLQAFQHRRLREGWGGSSSYRISEPLDPELYHACETICRRTNLTGVCMFEFRYNPETRGWVLLETNARFWGSLSLPVSLGVDFPRFFYDLLAHGTRHARVAYEAGVKSRNVVLDGFNLLGGLRRLGPGEIRGWVADLGDFLSQPVRLLSGRERSDSFVRDDLRPAFWECSTLAKSLAQKLTRSRNPQLSRRRGETPAVP